MVISGVRFRAGIRYAWTSQNVPPLSVHILIDLSGTFLLAMVWIEEKITSGQVT